MNIQYIFLKYNIQFQNLDVGSEFQFSLHNGANSKTCNSKKFLTVRHAKDKHKTVCYKRKNIIWFLASFYINKH